MLSNVYIKGKINDFTVEMILKYSHKRRDRARRIKPSSDEEGGTPQA